MRRIWISLFTILMMSVLGFSERPAGTGKPDKDDKDDKGPIQSGYAVVTPTAGSTSIVAFETFGMHGHGENGTSQAGVLAPGLTTSAVLFVDSSGRLSKNLGVAIVNPNSAAVTVSIALRKADGTQLTTTDVSVPSHHQVSKFITELFSNQSSVPSDFTGTVVVTSSGAAPLPIAVIGLRFRGENFSTLPATSLSNVTTALPTIATGVGGTGALLLPQFAAGGGWATEVIIMNTGTTAATVRVDLFNADGAALSTTLNNQTGSSFTNLSIPPGGVLALAPRDQNGDDDF